MPNWCDNEISISGNDAEKIYNLIQSLKDDDGIMQALCSTDTDEFRNLQSKPMFHIFSDYYGTKWDFGKEDCSDIQYGNNELLIQVNTAWSPPIEFLRKLTKDFDVDARIEYFEGGNDFGGYELIADGESIESFHSTYQEAVYVLDNDLFWLNVDESFIEGFAWESEDDISNDLPFLTEEDLKQIKTIMKELKK